MEDDGSGSTRLVATSSVQRGRIPPQGVQEMPYHWPDVVEAPEPPRRGHGEGAYAVYHQTETGGDVRVSHTTLVQVDREGGVETVRVDSLATVQRRAFLELMDRERAFSERLASRWRERLGRRLAAQRAAARRLRSPRLSRVVSRIIRVEARAGNAVIGLVRRVLRGIVTAPDALVSSVIRARTHVGGREGRRSLRAGLTDPASLSAEQKGVLLFLTMSLALLVVLLGGSVFSLILPWWAGEYQRVVGDATAAFLGAVALPLPTEPFIIATTLAEGPALGFLGAFAGKMLGVYVLYLFGDALHDKVESATAGKPRMQRVVAWIRVNADRHGFLLLVLVNAVPLFPDLFLYAFALSGMGFRRYMAGIALGTAIKFGGIIAGVLLVGPERVGEILANPFQAFS